MQKYKVSSGDHVASVDAPTEIVAIAVFLAFIGPEASVGETIHVEPSETHGVFDTTEVMEYLGFHWEEPYEQHLAGGLGTINLN